MQRPRVVVLSGSTRFRKQFDEAAERLTLEGVIVLMPHVWVRSDPAYVNVSEDVKFDLDELHLAKIDMADEVLIINPEGYIGSSTSKEIDYANRKAVPVRYLVERTPLHTTPVDILYE